MINGVHVSIDIEACGEVLMSLGACTFDPQTGESLTEFYGVLDMGQQIKRGLRFDAAAFSWWLQQSDEARAAVREPKSVKSVLHDFSLWMPEGAWAWAYPTSFDLPVIANVYRAFDKRVPWKWTNTLDGRTLWRLACAINPALERVEKDANPTPHHALADAKEQARWFARYLPAVLGISAEPAQEREEP